MKFTDLLKKGKYVILILFIIAAIPRIIYFFDIINFPLTKIPVLDSEYYYNWAKNILSGDIFSKKEGVFYLSPGYPYFLSFVFFVFGNKIFYIYLIQFLSGILSSIIVFFVAGKYFSITVSFMTAVLAALYNVPIFMEGLLLTNSLINFLNMLSLFFLLYIKEEKMKYLIGGFIISISSIFRPNIIIFPAILSLYLIFNKEIKNLFFLIIGLTIIIIPVASRNMIIGKELEIFAATGGMNFYIGNNKNSTGTYQDFSFDSASPFNQGESYRKKASENLKRELTKGEASRYWFKYTLIEMIHNKKRNVHLLLRKIKLFWHFYEIPMNFSFDYFAYNLTFLKNSLLTNSKIILPLILTGLILCILFDFKKMLFLLIFSLSYIVGIIMFFVSGEYRYPVIFLSIIFIGWLIDFNYNSIRDLIKYFREGIKNNLNKAISTGIKYFLFLIIFIFSFYYTRKPEVQIKYFGRERIKLGIALVETGEIEKGIMEIKSAEKEISEASTNYNLGKIYLTKLNDLNNAVKEYYKALKLENNKIFKVKYIKELNEILIKQGKHDEALNNYLYGISLDEKNYSFYQFAGNIFFLKKDKINCIRYWRKSLEIYPENNDLRKNLTVIENEKR